MKKSHLCRRIAAGILALVLAGMDVIPAMAAETPDVVTDGNKTILSDGTTITMGEDGQYIIGSTENETEMTIDEDKAKVVIEETVEEDIDSLMDETLSEPVENAGEDPEESAEITTEYQDEAGEIDKEEELIPEDIDLETIDEEFNGYEALGEIDKAVKVIPWKKDNEGNFIPDSDKGVQYDSLTEAVSEAPEDFGGYNGLLFEINHNTSFAGNLILDTQFERVEFTSGESYKDGKILKAIEFTDKSSLTVSGEVYFDTSVSFVSLKNATLSTMENMLVDVCTNVYPDANSGTRLEQVTVSEKVKMLATGAFCVSDRSSQHDGAYFNSCIESETLVVYANDSDLYFKELKSEYMVLSGNENNSSIVEVNDINVPGSIDCDSYVNLKAANIKAGRIEAHGKVTADSISMENYGYGIIEELYLSGNIVLTNNAYMSLSSAVIGGNVILKDSCDLGIYGYVNVEGIVSLTDSQVWVGENDVSGQGGSFYSPKTVTMTQSYIYVGEKAEFNAPVSVLSKASEDLVVGGNYTIANYGTFISQNITMKAGTFFNDGIAYLADTSNDTQASRNYAANLCNFVNVGNAVAIVGKFSNTGSFVLDTDSYFVQRNGDVIINGLESWGDGNVAYIASLLDSDNKRPGKLTINNNVQGREESVAITYITNPVTEYGSDDRYLYYVSNVEYLTDNIRDMVNSKNAMFAGQPLFYTNVTSGFPVKTFMAFQQWDNADRYLVQKNNGIYATIKPFTVTENGTLVGTYTSWNDVVKTINAESDPLDEFSVLVYSPNGEEVVVDGPLTIPSNINMLIIEGLDETDTNLCYTGDLKLNTNLEIRNLSLNDGSSSYSAINCGNYSFYMDNVKADYVSKITANSDFQIHGTQVTAHGDCKLSGNTYVNGSKFVLQSGNLSITGFFNGIIDGSEVKTEKGNIVLGTASSFFDIVDSRIESAQSLTYKQGNIFELGELGVIENSVINAKGDALFTGTTFIKDTSLTTDKNLSFDNIIAGENVCVNYGQNTSNTFKVNGEMRSYENGYYEICMGSTYTETINSKDFRVKCNALTVSKISAGNNYTNGDVIVDYAPKAEATWFKVVSNENGVIGVTERKGDKLTFTDTSLEHTKGVDVYLFDDEYIASYDTVAEAVNALNKNAKEYASYTIKINSDDATAKLQDYTFGSASIEGVSITVDGRIDDKNVAKFKYNSKITANCNVIFTNIELCPANDNNTAIVINKSQLNFGTGSRMRDNAVINTVTGKGSESSLGFYSEKAITVNTVSYVGILYSSYYFDGETKDIEPSVIVKSLKADMIYLNRQIVLKGNNTIGNIGIESPSDEAPQPAELVLGVTTTRQNGKVVSSVSKTTINGEVYFEGDEDIRRDFNIKLIDDKTGEILGNEDVDDSALAGGKLKIAKFTKYGYYNVDVVIGNEEYSNEELLVKKGILYPSTKGAAAVLKYYDYENDFCVLGYCESTQDAMDEIDFVADQREYTIILLKNDETVLSRLPQSKNISYLWLSGLDENNYSDRYTLLVSDKLKLTSDTSISNIGLLIPDNKYVLNIDAGNYYLQIENQIQTRGKAVNLTGKNFLMYAATMVDNGQGMTSPGNIRPFYGSINGFAGINVQSRNNGIDDFVIADYVSDAKGTIKPATLSCNYLYLAKGMKVKVGNKDLCKSNVKVKDLYFESETSLEVYGDLNVSGETTVMYENASIDATGKFALNTILVRSNANLTLGTSLAKNGKPNLVINGNVVNEDSNNLIKVAVKDYSNDSYVIIGKDGVTDVVLTAPKASPDVFEIHKDSMQNTTGSNPHARQKMANKDALSAVENPDDWYSLYKSGNEIKYISADQIKVMLETPNEFVGFYSSVNEASKVIDSFGDNTQRYFITLLRDTDEGKLVLPKVADEVILGGGKKMSYSGNITINCDTQITGICLDPASQSTISGGKYELIIGDQTTVASGKSITKITGNGHIAFYTDDIFTVNGDIIAGSSLLLSNVDVTGNVQSNGYTVITDSHIAKNVTAKSSIDYFGLTNTLIDGNLSAKTMSVMAVDYYNKDGIDNNVKIAGNLNATTLFFDGGETTKKQSLEVKGKITVGGIFGEAQIAPEMIYYRDASDKSNLTVSENINGKVKFEMVLPSGKSANDYRVNNIKDTRKLATIKGIYNSDNVTFAYKSDGNLKTIEASRTADGGIFDNTGLGFNTICLKSENGYAFYGEPWTQYMYDWSEAVKMINNFNDTDAEYTVSGLNGETDPVATDAIGAASTITMPAAKKYDKLTINGTSSQTYIGGSNCQVAGNNLKVYGNVEFNNVYFKTSDKKKFTMTHTVNDSIEGGLISFKNYQNGKDGSLTKIVGDKKNDIEFNVNEFVLANGMTNCDDVMLNGAKVYLGNDSTINRVTLNKASGKTSEIIGLKKLTLGSVNNCNWEMNCIGTVLDSKENTGITIQNVSNSGVAVKVYPYTTTIDSLINNTAKELTKAEYLEGIKLVKAQCDSAGKYIAYPLATRNEIEIKFINTDYVAGKTIDGYVYNVKKSDMAVRMEIGNTIKDTQNSTYFKSFEDAVKAVDSLGDRDIRLELLKDTDLTKLTLPKKEVILTIGSEGNECKKFVYPAGQLKTQGKGNVVFDNVILSEKDKNSSKLAIKPSISSNTSIGFTSKTQTYANINATNPQKGVINAYSVSGNGNLGINAEEGNVRFNVEGNMQVNDIHFSTWVDGNANYVDFKETHAERDGYTTKATTVYLDSKGKTVINNITGDGAFVLYQYASRTNDIFKSKTNLTINGRVSLFANIGLVPMYYENGEYHGYDEDSLPLIYADPLYTPEYMKLVNAPTESFDQQLLLDENFNVLNDECGQFFMFGQQDGGIYLYQMMLPIKLIAENRSYSLANWDQVVRVIDKANDPNMEYTVILENNLGNTWNTDVLSTFKIPTKCKKLMFTTDNEGALIYTLADKFTFACETEFNNVQIIPLKKVGKTYERTTATLNIGKNRFMISGDMGWFAYGLFDVKGAAGSTLEINTEYGFGDIRSINGVDTVCLRDSITVPDGITKVNTLKTEGNKMIEITTYTAAVNVKDYTANASTAIYAGDITVSGLTTFGDTGYHVLSARNNAQVGHGAISLNNVVAESECYVWAKEDKNGESLFKINGTIENNIGVITQSEASRSPVFYVALFRKNGNDTMKNPYDGMILAKGKKLLSGDFAYNLWEYPGTGERTPDPEPGKRYYTYKEDGMICCELLGDDTSFECELEIFDYNKTDENYFTYKTFSEYKSYEEAVKDIDAMGITEQITENGKTKNVYKEYALVINNDVCLIDSKDDYKPLILPSKASNFAIIGNGYSIEYKGSLSFKCNTAFVNVTMKSMMEWDEYESYWDECASDWNAGSYDLMLKEARAKISNLTGSGNLTLQNSLPVDVSEYNEYCDSTAYSINGFNTITLIDQDIFADAEVQCKTLKVYDDCDITTHYGVMSFEMIDLDKTADLSFSVMPDCPVVVTGRMVGDTLVTINNPENKKIEIYNQVSDPDPNENSGINGALILEDNNFKSSNYTFKYMNYYRTGNQIRFLLKK